MGNRIVLHIGAMKTGTSFIQSALTSHPEALAEADATFLEGFGAQTRATLDLLRFGDRQPSGRRHRWAQLGRAARRTEAGTAVVSMEFLSFARGVQVERALAELHGLDVQVVLTVRDQTRVLPAQWQTLVRNMGTEAWDEYLRAIARSRGKRSRAWRAYHRAQDVPAILEQWVPRTEVTVVTVPPPGAPPDLLWSRFCQAAGLDLTDLDVRELRANPSLGYASCEYVRRLNQHLPDVKAKRYRRAVRPLVRSTLVGLRSQEDRPVLDRAAAEFALAQNSRARQAVTGRGCRVVGSPDDLPGDAELGGYADRIAPPDPDQVLRAAGAAWRYVVGLEGRTGEDPPEGLPAILADTARGLATANGWR